MGTQWFTGPRVSLAHGLEENFDIMTDLMFYMCDEL